MIFLFAFAFVLAVGFVFLLVSVFVWLSVCVTRDVLHERRSAKAQQRETEQPPRRIVVPALCGAFYSVGVSASVYL